MSFYQPKRGSLQEMEARVEMQNNEMSEVSQECIYSCTINI